MTGPLMDFIQAPYVSALQAHTPSTASLPSKPSPYMYIRCVQYIDIYMYMKGRSPCTLSVIHPVNPDHHPDLHGTQLVLLFGLHHTEPAAYSLREDNAMWDTPASWHPPPPPPPPLPPASSEDCVPLSPTLHDIGDVGPDTAGSARIDYTTIWLPHFMHWCPSLHTGSV